MKKQLSVICTISNLGTKSRYVVLIVFVLFFLLHIINQHKIEFLECNSIPGAPDRKEIWTRDEERNEQTPGNISFSKQHLVYSQVDHPKSFNNTLGNSHTIIFNRVPKVGSSSLSKLFKYLSPKNNFDYFFDWKFGYEFRLNKAQLRHFTKNASEWESPVVIIRHLGHINFTEFGYPQPIYINIIRDPVEREISEFYYKRKRFLHKSQSIKESDIIWLKKDFETCVLMRDRECIFEGGASGHWKTSSFFCGQDRKCSVFNSRYSLMKAKENVERDYAVVGLLEEMNPTLSVLEHYIPRFFAGARHMYYESNSAFANQNRHKPQVSEHVKDLVRKNFTRDFEFYEFCKQRLYKQYMALKLTEDFEGK